MMKKLLLTIIFLPFLAFADLTYENFEVFDGDRHGEFVGDLVAVLHDGSKWKIHPKDKEAFEQWNFGDSIQVRYRTSFYWFKREHKFELYNNDNDEALRVMLVAYPNEPIYVLYSEAIRTGYRYIPQNHTGPDGKITHVTYMMIPQYRTDLYLSDGTVWSGIGLRDWSGVKFEEGTPVYFGANDENIFIIVKDQREAWPYFVKESQISFGN